MDQLHGEPTGGIVLLRKIVVGFPDELVRSPETASQELLEAALLQAYLMGRITIRSLGKVLGLDLWQAERFLEARGVPLNYGENNLELDRTSFPMPA